MPPGGRRERKKAATREALCEAATRLFLERGFDAVTVAEIADAADVSKMTVFNYFERKEDMFFDRDAEAWALMRGTIVDRRRGERPLRAVGRVARELVEARHPFAKFTADVSKFWRVIEKSAALRARARELRDEAEAAMATLLAEAAGVAEPDPTARLVGAMIVDAWRVAYTESLKEHRRGRPSAEVHAAFLARLDAGLAMVAAAARATPYG
jgi:AcrR family transcriptional regulator